MTMQTCMNCYHHHGGYSGNGRDEPSEYDWTCSEADSAFFQEKTESLDEVEMAKACSFYQYQEPFVELDPLDLNEMEDLSSREWLP